MKIGNCNIHGHRKKIHGSFTSISWDFYETTFGSDGQAPLSHPVVEHLPRGTSAPRHGSEEEIARALRQVVSAHKVEYMRFDGDPIRYVPFMPNFETCLFC